MVEFRKFCAASERLLGSEKGIYFYEEEIWHELEISLDGVSFTMAVSFNGEKTTFWRDGQEISEPVWAELIDRWEKKID